MLRSCARAALLEVELPKFFTAFKISAFGFQQFFQAVCSFFLAFAAQAQYALKAPIADKPAVLTSSGQSADIEMVKVLLDRAKVPYKLDARIAASL